MTDHSDAQRRVPSTPEGAFDLLAAADELLGEARAQQAGRAARTLTPGEGAALKQTMLALLDGRELSDHRAPGAATLIMLRGGAVLSWQGHEVTLGEGHWAAIPPAVHAVRAHGDAVLLLTVARD